MDTRTEEYITQAEFQRLLDKYCEGKEYDNCITSPCPYASKAGCTHYKISSAIKLVRSGQALSDPLQMGVLSANP